MHLFFQQNPYRADGSSDLENDAKLALHLILFLTSTQNPDDGTWPGPDPVATLSTTCHSLESLHLLGWEATADKLEAGVSWLVNLPGPSSSIAEDGEILIRSHPSRFKTLAWLGRFADSQLKSDFESLEQHLDKDGLLSGVLAKPLLATMVYVDCLNHLEKQGCLSMLSQQRRARALDRIEEHVRLWQQDMQQKTHLSSINTIGDLSYAIDLLFRAERLSRRDKISKDALSTLLSALKNPERLRPISADILYCAIQLATHFPEVRRAKVVLQAWTAHLRTKYEKLDLKKEAAFFHPLVLRLLLSYHGERLKEEVIRLLLEQNRKSLESRSQSTELGLRDDFRALIKKRFEVELCEVQPLTGGITSAKVFRVRFSLKLRSTGEEGECRTDTYHPSPDTLVIKTDSPESLRRAIGRYRGLPDALKPHFAQYGDPQVIGATPYPKSYLVMEDLTHMTTLRQVIDRIDIGTLSREQKNEMERVCHTVSGGLFSLYDQTRRGDRDFSGPQLSRLYIGDLEKNLIRICRPDRFPHLKTWLQAFWLGERRYSSIEYYLGKLASHEEKLRVPYLMLVHGDCHTRNIMLDPQLHRIKLIDMDNLDYDGDYIRDLALLIEDVSVFRFLFDDGYRFSLDKGQIRYMASPVKPRVIENTIEYSPFSSQATRLFQQCMLQHMELHAQAINDQFWKERLWLALAASLMFLVAKQTEKEYATVLYVEAVKLLDELVSHLDKGLPLGDIPFPGKHPAGVCRERDTSGLVPAWFHDNSVLADVHTGIIAFDPHLWYELGSSGRVAQYFAANSRRPFALIDGKKQPPCVLLACPLDALDDPLGLAQERETNSAFRTALLVSEDQNSSEVLRLVRQALQAWRTSEAVRAVSKHRGVKL